MADGSVELIEHRYYSDGRERVVPLARQAASGAAQLWCGLPVAGRGRWLPIRWLPGPRSVLGPLRRLRVEPAPLLSRRRLYEWGPPPRSRRLSARPRRPQGP